jgi:HD-GYP domain-containing protein (c-di-GMP phosphodiesterase class II)
LLHDIGKIGIPTAVLDKPGKLDPAEFEQIRAHPVLGARILEPIEAFDDVIGIVRHHHERFNGTGYPDRLAGVNIPFLARVLSVADVYDALVSDRPYREGWAPAAAVAYISERGGVEFDPQVVAAFVDLVGGAAWASANPPAEAVSNFAGAPA